jgi:amino acid adenylation domain-containing protein
VSRLSSAFERAVSRDGTATAVLTGNRILSYVGLDDVVNRLATALAGAGLCSGQRVCVWFDGGIASIATALAVLRNGWVYVPIDPRVPVSGAASWCRRYKAVALVTTPDRWTELADKIGSDLAVLLVEDSGALCEQQLRPLRPYLGQGKLKDSIRQGFTPEHWCLADASSGPSTPHGAGYDNPLSSCNLAYILQTSGSTGAPKGVCITHDAAVTAVNWFAEELSLTDNDVLLHHAAPHFDLSVLEVFGAFAASASISVPTAGTRYSLRELVGAMRRDKVTVAYLVPSILMAMIDLGGLLEAPELSLRAIMFAGEVLPIAYVRAIRARWPELALINAYGPTETNVCTRFRVPFNIPAEWQTLPIGRACAGNRVYLMDEDRTGQGVVRGEIVVEGSTVMAGYWDQPVLQNRLYKTGDLGEVSPSGDLVWRGRNDNQYKMRGYRVQPEEIEAVLECHERIRRAAVVLVGIGYAARLVGCLECVDGQPPDLREIKQHCATYLPPHLVVDRVMVCTALPLSSNGKVDRHALHAMCDDASRRT